MARPFYLVHLLIAFALAGESYATDSYSPSQPMTTTNTTRKSPPPAPPTSKISTNSQDYSDYEVPLDLAPGGVQIVEDYAPVDMKSVNGFEDYAQPEDNLNNKENPPKKSVVSSSSSFSFSYSFSVVVTVGLYLFCY